jgi:hypothetical protein
MKTINHKNNCNYLGTDNLSDCNCDTTQIGQVQNICLQNRLRLLAIAIRVEHDKKLLFEAAQNIDALCAVAEAAERALNYLADLNGSQWFKNPEHYATKDMAQRAKGLQQSLYTAKANLAALAKVKGEA